MTAGLALGRRQLAPHPQDRGTADYGVRISREAAAGRRGIRAGECLQLRRQISAALVIRQWK
jgi:hypothetical protein